MKLLLILLLTCLTIQAQSIKEGKEITTWTPVGFAADVRNRADGTPLDVRVEGNGRAELSFANVQRSEETFKGWVRAVFPSSTINLEGKWNEARFYVICDCRKNSIQALTGIAYGINGNIRAEKTKITMSTEPGSLGRDMLEFFCERGGPPATVAPKLKTK